MNRRKDTFRPRLELLENRLAPANYTVNTLTDPAMGSGAWNAFNRAGCSLRWAITDMDNNGDAANTINIRIANGGTIGLRSPLPTVGMNGQTDSIVGPGANAPVTVAVALVQGGLFRLGFRPIGAFRIFSTSAGATVTISGLTITGGQATVGGGVQNEGTLTLQDDTIKGNRADIPTDNPAASEMGGGVYSTGPSLTIKNSTISENFARFGAGVYINGGNSRIQDNSVITEKPRGCPGRRRECRRRQPDRQRLDRKH